MKIGKLIGLNMEQQKLTKFFLQIMGKVMTPHFTWVQNYVANYIYLTHAAYEIYNDGYNRYLNGTTTVAGAKVAGIKDRISRFPWPSYADTNWEKSLIVFGMALHVIGDGICT